MGIMCDFAMIRRLSPAQRRIVQPFVRGFIVVVFFFLANFAYWNYQFVMFEHRYARPRAKGAIAGALASIFLGAGAIRAFGKLADESRKNAKGGDDPRSADSGSVESRAGGSASASEPVCRGDFDERAPSVQKSQS
jgi:hypothetical protein